MLTSRIKTAAIVLAASACLAGCAYGPYGGVSVGTGYGSPYGYGGYGYDPYYSGYGYGSPYGYYGYGSPYGYYGWYDGFYYPGTGWYVYDHNHNRHPMTDAQKGFWQTQIEKWRQQHGTTGVKENWAGFNRSSVSGSTAATGTATATGSAQADQQSMRQIIEARRAARIEQQRTQSDTGATRIERQRDSSSDGSFREQIREHRARRAPGG